MRNGAGFRLGLAGALAICLATPTRAAGEAAQNPTAAVQPKSEAGAQDALTNAISATTKALKAIASADLPNTLKDQDVANALSELLTTLDLKRVGQLPCAAKSGGSETDCRIDRIGAFAAGMSDALGKTVSPAVSQALHSALDGLVSRSPANDDTGLIVRALVLISLSLAIVGCADMVQSTSAEFIDSSGEGCKTSFGAYHLPMAVLTVSVEPKRDLHFVDFKEEKFKARVVADPRQTFCLGFLSTITGEDLITVDRTPEGLLNLMTSDAKDRTPEIAAKLIDAGANFAIAGRSSLVGAATRPMTIEFDPFNPQDSASANEALRPYGYCVVVDETLEGESPERWCASRHKPRRADPLYQAAQAPPAPEAPRDEILYRPNQTYSVSVMRKRDPNGSARWDAFLTKKMDMPNRSPIFGIGVKRALFASRKTTLNFTNGVLDDVKIEKGSEALGFVSIPLHLVQTMVQIPTRIIQLQIGNADRRAQLIDAQGKLIQAWSTYNATLAGPPKTDRSAAADAASRSLRIGEAPALERSCLDVDGPSDYCASLARGARP